jgi:glycosyltransferase involved in cell wall biosynthesis
MQEIYPAIEKSWLRAEIFFNYKTELTKFDCSSRSKLLATIRLILDYDFVILPDFLPALILLLRKNLDFRGRFIIHSHGNGTKCFSKESGALTFLEEQDIIVSASRSEAKSIKLCLPKARVEVVPFAIGHQRKVDKKSARSKVTKFVYVGRVSEQKNLHTLIAAFALAFAADEYHKNQRAPVLEIFGKPDGLGSPNMGFASKDYLRYLKMLVKNLGVEKSVKWRGFVYRDKIQDELSQTPHIFCSPSLHSDEDFGTAALYSLSLGAPAILSRWGGHIDFESKFGSRQVTLLPVTRSPTGPFLSPFRLAEKMTLTLNIFQLRPQHISHAKKVFNSHYSVERVSRNLARLISRTEKKSTPLQVSRLISATIARAQKLRLKSIYSGYDDKSANIFFKAYGAQDAKWPIIDTKNIWIVPWAKEVKNRWIINDPHRGRFDCSYTQKQASYKWLIENGFAFAIDKIND